MGNTQVKTAFRNIADAIRSKGITGTMKPEDMPSKISEISGGGGGTGTVTLTANGLYNVNSYASAQVDVGEETGTISITTNGIHNIKGFASADIDVHTATGTYSISDNGTYDIESYLSVNVNVQGGTTDDRFNKLIQNTLTYLSSDTTSIGTYGVANHNITAVYLPNCTKIGSWAFNQCMSLKEIYAPECANLDTRGQFYYCNKLTSVNFPKCSSVPIDCFSYCTTLKEANVSSATVFGDKAFGECSYITEMNAPNLTSMGAMAFYHCYRLTALYLTGSNFCSLANVNAFTSTPIGGYSTKAGCYGSIYVPASLLATYQSAANWVNYSSRFVGV